MEITEEDAIVLADVREGKKPRLGLRAARLLRGKLDTLIQQLSAEDGSVNHRFHNMIPQPSDREDVIEDGGASRDAVAGEATCEHSCACHGAVMDPRIWSNLPKELLQLVFARLPPDEKFRLYWLFEEWNQSSFRRVATETHDGKMLARISRTTSGYPEVTVHLCDIKSNRWHKLTFSSRDEVPCQAMSSDGGLVCMVSVTLDGPVRIVVCNPLTRAWRELPSHPFSMIQPDMAQLVMNHDTKCYKVLVAGGEDGVDHAIVYDSATGLWSDANLLSDRIHGYWYRWVRESGDKYSELTSAIDCPCVYDCETGQLLFRDATADAISYALVKDRLFVLRNGVVENSRGRFWSKVISEYQASAEGNSDWVQLRVHECRLFTEYFGVIEHSKYDMTLLACRGLLLVVTDNTLMGPFMEELLWIYDLDTREWYEPIAPPERFFINYDTAMCELQWDAVP